MASPKPTPKSKVKPKLTDSQIREKVLKDFGMTISPKGVAAADAAAKKALEEKYPGMFIPQTRTTAGVKKVGKK